MRENQIAVQMLSDYWGYFINITTQLEKRNTLSNPIPDFDHNLVLPPHLGNPTFMADISPYKCTTLQLCEKYATSQKRIDILKGFISFRQKLYNHNVFNGFQWIDGSFLEDVATREKREPNDLDVVTLYWGYDIAFQKDLMVKFPEFADNRLSKNSYLIDHFPFDISITPFITVDMTRYWMQLFSHNRDGVWKGMLQINIDTPNEDRDALAYLNATKL